MHRKIDTSDLQRIITHIGEISILDNAIRTTHVSKPKKKNPPAFIIK
jgi:hypothetical protein